MSKVPKKIGHLQPEEGAKEKAKPSLECNMHNKAASREVRRSHPRRKIPALYKKNQTRELSQDYLSYPEKHRPFQNLRPPSLSAGPIKT
jgi:hypothetical protein